MRWSVVGTILKREVRDQGRDPIRHRIRGAADHAAAIGMAAEDHLVELLPADQIDDIIDVHLKIDLARQQVASFAHAGERRREHMMALIEKRAPDPCPAPAAVPGTVHEDECRHLLFPPFRGFFISWISL